MAWKVHSPNRSFLNSGLLSPQPSKNAGSLSGLELYVCSRLALRPLGGSLVIFTLFCRMLTGKCSDGYEVSQSLKLGLVFSMVMFSQISSRLLIQDTARWQF